MIDSHLLSWYSCMQFPLSYQFSWMWIRWPLWKMEWVERTVMQGMSHPLLLLFFTQLSTQYIINNIRVFWVNTFHECPMYFIITRITRGVAALNSPSGRPRDVDSWVWRFVWTRLESTDEIYWKGAKKILPCKSISNWFLAALWRVLYVDI